MSEYVALGHYTWKLGGIKYIIINYYIYISTTLSEILLRLIRVWFIERDSWTVTI